MRKNAALLSDDDLNRVNKAVIEAAARTNARIVPVVIGSSGLYERAEDLVGLWAAAMAFALIWAFLSQVPIGHEWLNTGHIWSLGLLGVLAVITLGFIGGWLVATRIGWLRRHFIPASHVRKTVEARAKQIMCDLRVRDADSPRRPMLLILVSLYERCPIVLCNDDLQGKLTEQDQANLAAPLAAALKHNHLADALTTAVKSAGDMLANIFPAQPSDPIQSETQPKPCLTVIA